MSGTAAGTAASFLLGELPRALPLRRVRVPCLCDGESLFICLPVLLPHVREITEVTTSLISADRPEQAKPIWNLSLFIYLFKCNR